MRDVIDTKDINPIVDPIIAKRSRQVPDSSHPWKQNYPDKKGLTALVIAQFKHEKNAV